MGIEQPDVSSPQTGGLADRYAAAFAAHLDEGGESGLGAAYALGREAVAEQYSVLDFADAHHRALTAALDGRAGRPAGRGGPGRRGVHPREPVGVRDRRPRLPRGAGDRAHRARARRAAALARRRLGRDQLLADRGGDPAADRRRRPRGARAPGARRSRSSPPSRGGRRSARRRPRLRRARTPARRASASACARRARTSARSRSSIAPSASSPRATTRS